jgi:hypothetical protein
MDSKQRSNPDSLGFEAIDPWKSEYLAVRRRNLLHLEVPGATYFVTFRCRPTSELPAQARHLVLAAILECDQKSIDLDAAVIWKLSKQRVRARSLLNYCMRNRRRSPGTPLSARSRIWSHALDEL